MKFREATTRYEAWMRECAPIVSSELLHKHVLMKEDPFQFLRGTYYRWAQLWPEISRESSRAPIVLSVGDLHVDSFGTWRDAEGRMCWGVDDFDESWPLPYTNDLTRLAASVKIARRVGLLKIGTKDACEIILNSYRRTLRQGGCPFVLAEEETHMEKLGIDALKPPKSFWDKLNALPRIRGPLPRDAKAALENAFPAVNLEYRVVRRQAGLGSLGQIRYVAIADCLGGCVAREAKNVVPSANMWLTGRQSRRQSYYEEAMSSAIRSSDPYQRIVGRWLIRRLSPDSNPIKIEELAKKRDEEIIVQAMGIETANVHLGTRARGPVILRDLRRRGHDWLYFDAKKMAKAILQEWKKYRTDQTH